MRHTRTNTVARKDLFKGGAQARRLLANSQGPAKFVTESTIELPGEHDTIECHADAAMSVGSVAICAGETFFLVESTKFNGRFYAVVRRHGAWLCSSREERVVKQCIAKVEAMTSSETVAA